MRIPLSLVWALAATAARAQIQQLELLSDLSFGFGSRITQENSNHIPNFIIQGNPNLPELLSNKIILTPPAPGNQRGAVWSEKTLDRDEWVADVHFRVNGPERSGGNVNFWLVKDGEREVGFSSIYTVGRFDGLGLVIDTYGGSGGMIRAFLNDGTTDYKSSQVDSKAFAHCNYAYRNLGRPTQLKLVQTSTLFKVEVDGTLCFSSDRTMIPSGYKFGVSAASAENPDSVEVFKLAVLRDTTEAKQQQQQDQQNKAGGNSGDDSQKGYGKPPQRFSRSQPAGNGANNEQHQDGQGWEYEYETDIPDQMASQYASQKAQFEDVHNRLQSVNHHLSTIFHSISTQSSVGEKYHEETSKMIHDVRTALGKLSDLDSRMQNIERELRSIRTDLTHKVQATENNIKNMVGNTHSNIMKKVEDHAAPGHGRLYFIIIASQVVLVAAFLLYKRRKNSMPKKYL